MMENAIAMLDVIQMNLRLIDNYNKRERIAKTREMLNLFRYQLEPNKRILLDEFPEEKESGALLRTELINW